MYLKYILLRKVISIYTVSDLVSKTLLESGKQGKERYRKTMQLTHRTRHCQHLRGATHTQRKTFDGIVELTKANKGYLFSIEVT